VLPQYKKKLQEDKATAHRVMQQIMIQQALEASKAKEQEAFIQAEIMREQLKRMGESQSALQLRLQKFRR